MASLSHPSASAAGSGGETHCAPGLPSAVESLPHVIGFGEAMMRFAPIIDSVDGRGEPSLRANFCRSVGGDELNVAVAARWIGRHAEWVSVVPSNLMGDLVCSCATDAGVSVDNCIRDTSEGAELGIFTVVPEMKAVQYQRKNSSFAKQEGPGLFNWPKIYAAHGGAEGLWLHATGISPLCSDGAHANWDEHLRVATEMSIPFSVDLNYRPALGPLSKLWDQLRPHASNARVLVLALSCLPAFAALVGVPESVDPDTPADDESWVKLLVGVHDILKGPMVACCFKLRDEKNLQTRWSVVVDGHGVHTTRETPVLHTPKDECGGGSAWSAGIIDAFAKSSVVFTRTSSGHFVVAGVDTGTAARRGDLLAALCQEEFGDHSTVTRELLESAVTAFTGCPAPISVSNGKLVSAALHGAAVLTAEEASRRVRETHKALKEAVVLGILRAKRADEALRRGLELVELGCKALEVTVDSQDFAHLVQELQRRVGDRCVIGAGTVCNLEELALAADAGARFALSPIHPNDSFVKACHSRGILAVPAAYTPQEIYNCVEAGALAVKLFPAQLWAPDKLKQLCAVGMFGSVDIFPSGGITPENVSAWLAAGAAAVGMGSCLVGGEIRAGDDAALEAARIQWTESGRDRAADLFRRIEDGSIRS